MTAFIKALKPSTYAEFSATEIENHCSQPPWSQRTKIVASEGEICAVLLAWSGLRNLWNDHELGSKHSFFNDVVMLCDGLGIDTEDREESPLRQGSNYTVLIHQPEMARSQMAKAVYGLIAERLGHGNRPVSETSPG